MLTDDNGRTDDGVTGILLAHQWAFGSGEVKTKLSVVCQYCLCDETTTVKPVYNSNSQKDHKMVFETNYRLMQVKSIAECSKGSILQYFQPSLSYHLSLRSLFCLFSSGRFTQVLLYELFR